MVIQKNSSVKSLIKVYLAQLKTVAIVNLDASSEEESRSDLENEFFSFGISDLDNKNTALELFKELTAQISKFFIPGNQQETNSSILSQNKQSNKNQENILENIS
ncbi:6361_t:CDS:2, partial [Diversispora eburnea]